MYIMEKVAESLSIMTCNYLSVGYMCIIYHYCIKNIYLQQRSALGKLVIYSVEMRLNIDTDSLTAIILFCTCLTDIWYIHYARLLAA